ncbi:MAG TPA: hypothetical protein VLA37_05330 [Sphingomonadaceae bacterium]|nr:hypothetical protein [Sphingomonadaceae bacterium]
MKLERATRVKGTTLLFAGTAAAVLVGAPIRAQVPDEVVLNIMRECAKIDDPTSRLACYDNNIRAGGSDGGRPVVPGESGTVQGGRGIGGGSGAQGFGAEDVRNPDRFDSYQERGLGVDEITARVASVRQREPGIYLVTLEGGAEWLFTDTVPFSFRPPRPGDTVEIGRAALGSFLMRVGDQQSVRVRRIR